MRGRVPHCLRHFGQPADGAPAGKQPGSAMAGALDVVVAQRSSNGRDAGMKSEMVLVKLDAAGYERLLKDGYTINVNPHTSGTNILCFFP